MARAAASCPWVRCARVTPLFASATFPASQLAKSGTRELWANTFVYMTVTAAARPNTKTCVKGR
eukprot:6927816-Prymnesium_polylepis.1